MHESLGEKLIESFSGAKWEKQYYKNDVRDADIYIRENTRIINTFKKKYPNDWKKRVGGYVFDLKYFKKQKNEGLAHIKRWEAIQKAHKKLRGVV